MIPNNLFIRNIELTNHKYFPLNKPYFDPDIESERIITKDSSEYVRSFFSSKLRDLELRSENNLITYIKEHYNRQHSLELDVELKKNLEEEDLSALKERYKEDVTEASFFWDQAIEFYKGTINMDVHVKPLSIYYFMLNAAKALLVYNGVLYKDRNSKNVYHGVTGLDLRNVDKQKFLVRTSEHRIIYFNENSDLNSIQDKQIDYNFIELNELYIQSNNGVFANLGNFFNNNIKSKEIFSLDDLISNLVFVHRAYSICKGINIDGQLFIPLESQCFGTHPEENKFLYYFKIDTKYKLQTLGNIIDLTTYVSEQGNHYMIKSDQSYSNNFNDIKSFILDIRQKHQYIAGVKPRWYLMKATDCDNIKNLELNPLVILLGIFHRLSEFSRYNPLKLKNLLDSKKNETSWLLRELIENAAYQFLDLISSEITHKEFHLPRTY
ncbi:YaaC family protein [Lysinibacillus sp. JNUCC-52]|uniref:YaaC family protein n=1 Tax=Lysinibacillus sp. JNUCC-52 TaxID=2792480 RepID=UPI0019351EC6|nr:hypothetical protein JNUCC52_00930 [Lysinibacillus sp. JNUCC-52]